MWDEGKESGHPLILGWESDFKEQKHLCFMLALFPDELWGCWIMATALPFLLDRGRDSSGLREEELEKYDLDTVSFCSVHSFASLHLTFHPLLIRTCYVSGTELDVSQIIFHTIHLESQVKSNTG